MNKPNIDWSKLTTVINKPLEQIRNIFKIIDIQEVKTKARKITYFKAILQDSEGEIVYFTFPESSIVERKVNDINGQDFLLIEANVYIKTNKTLEKTYYENRLTNVKILGKVKPKTEESVDDPLGKLKETVNDTDIINNIYK